MGIKEIEHYAKEHHVPIMEQEGIQFLTKYIQEHEEICQILEIGSAIGYSAIRMAQIRKTIHVTTIERDLERYQKAVENIQKCISKSKLPFIIVMLLTLLLIKLMT